MPIYEYKCSRCGEVSEVFFKTQSRKDVLCSHCGSAQVEKMFSVPAAVKMGGTPPPGATCCGREERCDTPPCSVGEGCRRDR